MKDNYQELFCSVLTAGLWNKAPEVWLTGADMKKVWNDSQKQAVSGLVAEALLATKRIHPRTAEMLQNKLLSIAAMNFKQQHILANAVRVLQNEGIEPILLKGRGVASFYHQPLLRECGDIDLYVGTRDYKNSFDILERSLENIEEKKYDATEKHSHLVVKGIPIELHQFSDVQPSKYDAIYQKISDEGLASGHIILRVDDVDVRTPEPTFNAFYIFNHLWRHFIAVGVGFRQICDWVMLLHSYSGAIDRDRLAGVLVRLDLMKPWKVFGYIAVNMLGLPENEMPFYDPTFGKLAHKVLPMIMKEGNFGHERDDRWTESGHPLKDIFKVFIISTFRYIKLLPMFGGLAWQEYKMRILQHLGK